MKIISAILIVAYLMLPAICSGHPCDALSANSPQSITASDAPGECPLQHDTDECETTCCCAGHLPLPAFMEISQAYPADRQQPYEPHLALPRLIDRIFVPPQNVS
jgi:hypothetical protein